MNDDPFATVTGVSAAFALGTALVAVIRMGRPRGRTLGDPLDLHGNWKPVIGLCCLAFVVGIVGQLAT